VDSNVLRLYGIYILFFLPYSPKFLCKSCIISRLDLPQKKIYLVFALFLSIHKIFEFIAYTQIFSLTKMHNILRYISRFPVHGMYKNSFLCFPVTPELHLPKKCLGGGKNESIKTWESMCYAVNT
jgi:hypothetical protein